MTVRTTIRLNPDLARQAKQHAARTNRSFTQLIEQAVQRLLSEERKPRRRKKIVLPVAGDPNRRITEEEYRQAIDQMYEEEAERIIKGYS